MSARPGQGLHPGGGSHSVRRGSPIQRGGSRGPRHQPGSRPPRGSVRGSPWTSWSLWASCTSRSRISRALAAPLAFLAMAYASLSPNISDRIQPLIPALKSNWLIAHVITCFLGCAAFAAAFGFSLMFLLKKMDAGRDNGILAMFPVSGVLDDLTHRMVMFGFLFLTIGIITGSVWANSARGTYWSWDPKETWSLITWFVYATLLHVRITLSWRGDRIAWLSILGFAAVLFTYFGVNYLPGLHGYGS
ncbi:MAG: c-type cytochrome biogenesis protein CcsB [Desulfobacterales bacterium]|nr:c-type cytochrome biogenesis protein CcsB [Desulfobacterales bacterium]